jgi:hypothetical protein
VVTLKTRADAIDPRTIERAILKHASGCSDEHQKAVYYSGIDTIMHASALSKELLGIYGEDIGSDPRQRLRYALNDGRDFAAERRSVKSEDPFGARKLLEINQQEERAKDIDRRFDSDAWHQVIVLEDKIKRRSFALSRVWAPGQKTHMALVNVNIQDLMPVAAVEREVQLGNQSGGVPWDGTIQITDLGLYVVTSGKWPRPRANKPGVHPLDQELELVP